MRVLFAITRGEVGGAQEHVRILAEGIVRRDHEVGVLVQSPSFLANAVASTGGRVMPWASIERNIDLVADLRARRELRAAVRSFRPDVLHLHSSKAGLIGRGLLHPPGGITVFTVHHAPFGPGRKLAHRITARPIEEFALRHVHGVISVGARDMPLLRKLAPAVPMALIRNAVPFDGPPVSPEQPVRTALWVARMKHPKDPLQAVKAWEYVVRRLPDTRLILCGEGPLAERLKRRVASSPARKAIEYAGKVMDLRPYQSAASIYLLATAVEGGTTMATLEAMTQGLVPVMNDAGDAFLLEHARCGVVVPRRSPKALADAVVDLFEHPDRLAAMRRNALAFARAGWSTDDMVDATLAFYRELIHQRRP